MKSLHFEGNSEPLLSQLKLDLYLSGSQQINSNDRTAQSLISLFEFATPECISVFLDLTNF